MGFFLGNLKTVIEVIIGIILVAIIIKNYAKIKKFLSEVKGELTKVAWSTKKELMASTILVITTTAIMAVFVGIVDLGLSRFLSAIFK
jgi:preprotein translocase subunit SecE